MSRPVLTAADVAAIHTLRAATLDELLEALLHIPTYQRTAVRALASDIDKRRSTTTQSGGNRA